MKPERGSAADRALIAELAERGIRVTARQLERWRQAGIIETKRNRATPGRGGSTSSYPSGTADTVAALLPLLSKHRRIELAVLALFSQGHLITEGGLKAAYQKHYKTLTEFSAPGRPATEDEWCRAQELAKSPRLRTTPAYRAWRRRISAMPERSESVQATVWNVTSTVAYTLQTGNPPTPETAREIAYAAGMPEVGEDEQAGEDFAGHLADLNFDALAAIVEHAAMRDLCQARDALRQLASQPATVPGRLFGPLRGDDLAIAVVAPALIPLCQLIEREEGEPAGERS